MYSVNRLSSRDLRFRLRDSYSVRSAIRTLCSSWNPRFSTVQQVCRVSYILSHFHTHFLRSQSSKYPPTTIPSLFQPPRSYDQDPTLLSLPGAHPYTTPKPHSRFSLPHHPHLLPSCLPRYVVRPSSSSTCARCCRGTCTPSKRAYVRRGDYLCCTRRPSLEELARRLRRRCRRGVS